MLPPYAHLYFLSHTLPHTSLVFAKCLPFYNYNVTAEANLVCTES